MTKKLLVSIGVGLSLFAQSSIAALPNTAVPIVSNGTSSANIASAFDDPNCEKTKNLINQAAEKKAKDFQSNQEQTTVKAKTFVETMEDCMSQIGGAFNNPFGRPDNPFDGFLDKLCQKGLDIVTSENPVTKAVNGLSISDPTGTFTYNPNLSVTRDGSGWKTTSNTQVNDTSSQLWGTINNKIPNDSLWSGVNSNVSGSTKIVVGK
jgi:hypothetical protein